MIRSKHNWHKQTKLQNSQKRHHVVDSSCEFYIQSQATGYASQHIWCLSQAKIKWEGCGRKGIRRKNGGDDGGGSLISPDGVLPSQMVGVSATVIFPCTIKSRRRFFWHRLTRAVPEKGT